MPELQGECERVSPMKWTKIDGLPPLYEEIATVDTTDGRGLRLCRPYQGGATAMLVAEGQTWWALSCRQVIDSFLAQPASRTELRLFTGDEKEGAE